MIAALVRLFEALIDDLIEQLTYRCSACGQRAESLDELSNHLCMTVRCLAPGEKTVFCPSCKSPNADHACLIEHMRETGCTGVIWDQERR